MHTGKQKQMNASYQASLVNRHIRRFTGLPTYLYWAFNQSINQFIVRLLTRQKGLAM